MSDTCNGGSNGGGDGTVLSEEASVAKSATSQEAVIFLREEGENEFVPIHHHHSVTLHELAQEYNISSVLECDAEGRVAARAVAFDSPSDVLHSGKHYIAKRALQTSDHHNENRVTFRAKITVQEYELENPTPLSIASSESDSSMASSGFATPASSLYESLITALNSSSSSATSSCAETFPAALFTDVPSEVDVLGCTPETTLSNTLSKQTSTFTHTNDNNNNNNSNSNSNANRDIELKEEIPQETSLLINENVKSIKVTGMDNNNHTNIAIPEINKKRHRDDGTDCDESETFDDDHTDNRSITSLEFYNKAEAILAEGEMTSSLPSSQEERVNENVLHEFTNTVGSERYLKQKSQTQICAIDDVEVEIPLRTRFIPFQADLHNDGKPIIVTLKDLQSYCDENDKCEAKFAEDHVKAEKIISRARSLLSSLSKNKLNKCELITF